MAGRQPSQSMPEATRQGFRRGRERRWRPPEPGFVHRVLIVVGIVLAVAGLVCLIWFAVRVWFVLFAGVLLAIFLRTLSRWVCQWTGVSTRWSLAIVIPGLLGIATLLGWLLAPSISDQFQELSRRLPEALDRGWQQIEQSSLARWIPAKLPPASEMTSALGNMASRVGNFFRVTVEVVVGVLAILFLGLYLAVSPRTYVNGLVRMFPIAKRNRLREVLDEVACTIQFWLLGQLASMIAVGVLIGFGLYLVGIPLPLALGVIAGVLEFIPVFGPIMAAVPAILLGLTESPMHAVYALAVFLAANQVEGHLIYPLAQRYALSLPPALTVFALTLGGALFGFLGLLLATPITAVAVVLIKRFYVEDVLGDPVGPGRCGAE